MVSLAKYLGEIPTHATPTTDNFVSHARME